MPFWRSDQRKRAFVLLTATILLNVGLVAIAVLITYWQNAFFNSLEEKDWPVFVSLLVTWSYSPNSGFMLGFAPILTVYVLFTAYALYLQQLLEIQWREWMTKHLLDSWLSDNTHYRYSLLPDRADNPDQRIADDIRLFVHDSLTLGIGFIRTAVSLVSFIILLWGLSRVVSFFGVYLPGSLVWMGMVYSAIGTALTHAIGKRLVSLNFTRERREADFRFALARLREYSEHVAFCGGEENEKAELTSRFGRIVDNFQHIIRVTKQVTLFATGYNQATLVFPLIVAAPAYFAGRIPLGGIFQTANAFNKLLENLSWFVENYLQLTVYGATISRLQGFVAGLEEVSSHKSRSDSVHRPAELEIAQFTLSLPDDRLLLCDAQLTVEEGERLLIVGPNGSGKTTLLKALAGIWPYYRGVLRIPHGRTLYLPQSQYIPLGTLRRAVCYPTAAEQFSTREIQDALEAVRLGHLAKHLDAAEACELGLSGGERQRLAVVQVLLHRPNLLFADEFLANVDPEGELWIYDLIDRHLPSTTILSVAHRVPLPSFFSRAVRFEDRQLESVSLDDVKIINNGTPDSQKDRSDARE
tara:strand:+ start:6038 stop:7786 length:1749 start_codon:yes stop_codon:yes gene_type:complete